MLDFNTLLFQAVYQGAGQYPLLDSFFILFTSYVAYVVVILTLLYMLFVYPLRTQDAKERFSRLIAGGKIVLAVFITRILVGVCKALISAPRPFVSLLDVVPLVHAAPLESFPSAHVAVTFATAIAILPYRKHLAHLLIASSFVVAISRLYVGVHYPVDIIGGMIVGYVVPRIVQKKLF